MFKNLKSVFYPYVYADGDTVGMPRFGSPCHRALVLLLALATSHPFNGWAQKSLVIQLPNVQITADRVLRGDGDTYGLGEWRCQFKASLEAQELVLEGDLIFSENANDFTTLVGTVRQRTKLAELEACRHCRVVLDEPNGSVGGPNIGARGARWYKGQGLIRRAKMTTDTFGEDVGHVGGVIQFAPLRLLVHCDYAMYRSQHEDNGTARISR